MEPLTEREGQVLSLLTDGLCNKHIATRLDISLGTVKAHLRSAFDKLGVHSRTEAILIAERRGILRNLQRPRARATETPASFPAPQPHSQIRHPDPVFRAASGVAMPFDA